MLPPFDQLPAYGIPDALKRAVQTASKPDQAEIETMEKPEARLMKYYVVEDSEQDELDCVRVEMAAEREERRVKEYGIGDREKDDEREDGYHTHSEPAEA